MLNITFEEFMSYVDGLQEKISKLETRVSTLELRNKDLTKCRECGMVVSHTEEAMIEHFAEYHD